MELPEKTGIIKDEIPIVRAKMREAMKNKDIKLATGFGSILGDLERLESDGFKDFIVYGNGTIGTIQ